MLPTLRQVTRSATATIAAAVAAACLAGCGIYSAEPITAWVVDADTGAPLEGVHVVATWEVRGGLEGGNLVGYLKVMETVTDKSGKFHFTGWGPRPNLHFGGVENNSPSLLFLKRGYEYRATSNIASVTTPTPSRFTSGWDGKTLRLSRTNDTAGRRPRDLDLLIGDVGDLRSYGNHWGEIYDFLCEMGFEVTRRLNQDHSYSLADLEERYGVRCPRR
jgi:hypothetical protein